MIYGRHGPDWLLWITTQGDWLIFAIDHALLRSNKTASRLHLDCQSNRNHRGAGTRHRTTRDYPSSMLLSKLCVIQILGSLVSNIGFIRGSDAFQSSRWVLADTSSSMGEISAKVSAISPIQCAHSCQLRSGCTRFCFGVSPVECYVTESGTSAPLTVTSVASLRCFSEDIEGNFESMFKVFNVWENRQPQIHFKGVVCRCKVQTVKAGHVKTEHTSH